MCLEEPLKFFLPKYTISAKYKVEDIFKMVISVYNVKLLHGGKFDFYSRS